MGLLFSKKKAYNVDNGPRNVLIEGPAIALRSIIDAKLSGQSEALGMKTYCDDDDEDFSFGGRGISRLKFKRRYVKCRAVIFAIESGIDEVYFAKDELTRLLTQVSLRKKPILIYVRNNKDAENNMTCDEIFEHFELDEIKDRNVQIQPFDDEKDEFLWGGIEWLRESLKIDSKSDWLESQNKTLWFSTKTTNPVLK